MDRTKQANIYIYMNAQQMKLIKIQGFDQFYMLKYNIILLQCIYILGNPSAIRLAFIENKINYNSLKLIK